MHPLRTLGVAATLALLVVAGTGCHHKRLEKPTDLASLVNADTYTEPTEGADDIGMAVRISNQASNSGGPLIIISVRNDRREEVAVYYRDLAFITGPDRKKDFIQISPETAKLDNVTPLILKPGERGAIGIPMKVTANFLGSRMVYNNPRNKIRFFVTVQ